MSGELLDGRHLYLGVSPFLVQFSPPHTRWEVFPFFLPGGLWLFPDSGLLPPPLPFELGSRWGLVLLTVPADLGVSVT